MKTRKIIATILILGTAAWTTLEAQPMGSTVEVVEVEVPVQVTVGSKPVRGLGIRDFEVYDRGVRQEVVSFEVVDLQVPVAEVPAPSGQAPPRRQTEAVRRMLLLFDFDFTPLFEIQRGVTGARKVVARKLHDADRLAVGYTSNTEGVVLLTGFTTDREELDLALDVVAAHAERKASKYEKAFAALVAHQGTSGVERLAARFGWPASLVLSGTALPDVGTAPDQGGEVASGLAALAHEDFSQDPVLAQLIATEPESLARDAEEQVIVDLIRSFTKNLGEVATLLGGVGGSRHILLFSEGLPELWLDPVALADLQEMHRAFLESGWTLHAIDLNGIPRTDAAFGIATPGTPPTVSGRVDPSVMHRLLRTDSGGSVDSLFYLADKTGGELYQNYNYFDQAATKLLEATSVTYFLRFQPSEIENDGRYHRLEVKLVGGDRGARVQHRAGYYAPRPEGSRGLFAERLDAAERLFGDEEVHELAAEALAVNGAADEALPVLVEIDGPSLFKEGRGPRTLSVQGFALDREGGVQDFFVQDLRLESEEARRQVERVGLKLYADLVLPTGEYRLRLLVQDTSTLDTYLATVPLEVTATRPALSPPLFVPPGAGAVFVREPEAGEPELFTVGGQLRLPSPRPEVQAGEVWPIYAAAFGLAEETVEARLVDAGGNPVVGGEVRIDRRLPAAEGGSERLLGALDVTGLAPGDYFVELASGAIRSRSAFSVRTGRP